MCPRVFFPVKKQCFFKVPFFGHLLTLKQVNIDQFTFKMGIVAAQTALFLDVFGFLTDA